MKKYIKPAIASVEVESTAILAGSITTCNELGNGVQLAKRHTVDFDDEEEDF